MSNPEVRSATEELLEDKPEYRGRLERIVEYEETNDPDWMTPIEDRPQDSLWEYDDVRVVGARLRHMVTRGIVVKVFDSNSTTAYALKDREAVKEGLKAVKPE